MTTATFDTLKFANTLKAAGVPDKQAEAKASVLGEALAVNFKELVTNDDLHGSLRESEQRLHAKIDNLEQRLNVKIDNLDAKIDKVEQRLDAKIDKVEQRLNAKIDTFAAKYDGQITHLKWMLGLVIALNVGVLIRLFIVRAL